ncbi:MAG: tyrosine--tRNA ligase [Alphaproteobacteria bacterium]|nr:tyrosine--tRNA ligase [Alphaproteobacteria bacterium]
MMHFKSPFLKEARERGFIYQCTDLEGLDTLMAEQSITGYLGFDPTADSLHVGHMVGLMFLRLLKKHGHTPIALVGGATAKLCDPSGKDAMRQMLSVQDIQNNMNAIAPCIERYLNYESDDQVLIVDNDQWLGQLNYIDLLRDYGMHFSVNRMLTFDSVKSRLEREQTLSFLEFNYMILQAYDFVELNKKHHCVLQLGGSDQWGNIVSGVDLGRRILNKTLYGLTAPLITTASGAKMGKSASGAIWLNANRLSPYDYWQFWRNTHDQDVGRYLRLFTDIPLDTISHLEQAEGAALNDVKKILADHATTLAHGREHLETIHKTVQSLFTPTNDIDLSHLPTYTLNQQTLESLAIEDVLVQCELVKSKGEARRAIEGRGIKINDIVVECGKSPLDVSLLNEEYIKLSFGKKKHHVIKVTA